MIEEKYILAPYLEIQYFDNSLYFCFGSISQVITDEKIKKPLCDILNVCLNPTTKDEIKKFCRQKGDNYEKALEILFSKNYLIPEKIFDKNNRDSRSDLFYLLNSANPEHVNQNLKKSHVVLIGCGGIGNIISVNLATHGIGEITLIDDDYIESSNLTRQIMFTEKDVGKYKVDILKRELKKRRSNCIVHSYKKAIHKIQEMNFLKNKNVSLIVLSGDEPGLLRIVNQFCIKNNIPFIHSGYINDISVYGPLVLPNQTGCWECQNHVISDEMIPEYVADIKQKINRNLKSPSIGPVNMISSAMATLDILKYLGKFSNVQTLNRRIGIHSYKSEFEFQDFNINKDCKNCGKR